MGLISKKAVKKIAKENGVRVSKVAYNQLTDVVTEIIVKAATRAKAYGKKTILVW